MLYNVGVSTGSLFGGATAKGDFQCRHLGKQNLVRQHGSNVINTYQLFVTSSLELENTRVLLNMQYVLFFLSVVLEQ